MSIRSFSTDDVAQINDIVHGLYPKWFDQNAIKNIPIDAQIGKTYITENNSEVVGFIIISSLEGRIWINWMGVKRVNHGLGIGTNLLHFAEKELKKLGVSELYVNTVVEQSPADGSYDLTVKFYLKNNFFIVEKEREQVFQEFKYKRGTLKKNL